MICNILEPAFFVKFYTDHISYVKSDQILAPAHEGDRTRNREVPGSIPGPSNFFYGYHYHSLIVPIYTVRARI